VASRHGISKMDKRANNFLLIGAICLAFVFAAYYGFITRPGIGTWWKQAAQPPEPISALRVGNIGEILAQTQNGDVYQFIFFSDTPWIKANDPKETIDTGICDPSDSKRYFIPPTPGTIKSRVDVHCVAIESAYHLVVVLLENGEIWMWRYDHSAYVPLLLPCFMMLALVTGFLSLIFGLVLRILKRAKK